MNNRVLTIHLLEGTATGLQTVEIDNWIGIVFVASKVELPQLLKQEEIKNALGIYVLVGEDPNQTGNDLIYVGQGNVTNRLVLHNQDPAKDYWDNKTLVITAKDNTLNTAICLYLESRLIDLARKSKSAITLTNQKYPALPSLSATDKTKAENFLKQALTLLPVLKIHYFDQPLVGSSPSSNPAPTTTNNVSRSMPSPLFTFVPPAWTAEAELVNNKFVVLKGALANPNEVPSIGDSNYQLRLRLRLNGSLADDPASGKWIFTEDVPFRTPSAAAGVIGGASIAGPTAWKVKGTQQTYRDWLQNQVNAVVLPTTGSAPTAGTTP